MINRRIECDRCGNNMFSKLPMECAKNCVNVYFCVGCINARRWVEDEEL